ncbi:MAG: SOS response-associated peptidase family protein [Hyphomicrobiales bacterium]|nr:SOS response-associated peptidase family protein [Hyphomicrobiales bacterium]
MPFHVINAKCETLATLPTFREAYRSRRCILPVDGFFDGSHLPTESDFGFSGSIYRANAANTHRRPCNRVLGPHVVRLKEKGDPLHGTSISNYSQGSSGQRERWSISEIHTCHFHG